MYCPQCGATNDDSAGVCGACGLDLVEYRAKWQSPEARSQPPYQQQYEQRYQAPPYDPAGYSQVAAYRTVPQVPNYLGWAIAVLICCFWPTGIPAVVFATQVNDRLLAGDIAGAKEASRKAKMWCWISFAIGVALAVIVLIFVVFAAMLFEGSGHMTY